MKQKPYKYMVRLPAEMRDLIAESAEHYRRSMNSDIVARLQQTFRGLPDDTTETNMAPPLHNELEQLRRSELNDEEQRLLRTFRRLGKEKRAALLDLLK